MHSRSPKIPRQSQPSHRRIATIIDADLGSDPDAAAALTIAARRILGLALVLTCDDPQRYRARFARQLLDSCQRRHVPVAAGTPLAHQGPFCVTDLLDPDQPEPAGDPVSAVTTVAERVGGPIRWIGLGPMTNLAATLQARPELASRLHIVQAGGGTSCRDLHSPEHSIGRDVPAARAVINTAPDLTLLLCDTVSTPELQITPGSSLYQHWNRDEAPAWQRLLAAHLDRWCAATGKAGSAGYGPLTLQVALGLPGVSTAPKRIRLDDRGRIRLDPFGAQIRCATTIDYPTVEAWTADQFATEVDAATGAHPPGPPM